MPSHNDDRKNHAEYSYVNYFLQSKHNFDKPEQKNQQGEYYFLTLSTLLGMYLMISSGHFLLFFIGLEMASIPMATLVAFNKHCEKSAEAGAKFILLSAFLPASCSSVFLTFTELQVLCTFPIFRQC